MSYAAKKSKLTQNILFYRSVTPVNNAMAESSKFLSYFGSKRKAANDDCTEENIKQSKSSEYEFNLTKLTKYKKEFQFWNTPNQKPCDHSKRGTWIEVNALEKKYFCWVCQQYRNLSNSDNEVTKGLFKISFSIHELCKGYVRLF